jgi:hypothetical protein
VATTREWSDAYLAQARADLEAAGQLGGAVPSVFAMLMQMALEKIAKAWLLRTGQIDLAGATSSHLAASRMVALLKRDRRRLATLGYGDAYAWKDVLPLVQELERAHPQLAEGGAQLEYPWEQPDGSIAWPARDLSLALRLGDPRSTEAARLLRFARQLSEQFEAIVPE